MQKDKIHKNFAACSLAGLLSLATVVQAQESANPELDACVKQEMIALTVKGAGLGAIAAFGAAMLSGKKDDTANTALIGAAVGGAAGLATGFFTANNNCFKKNPGWIPESRIERTQDYAQVVKATKYKRSQGIKFEATQLSLPNRAKPGSNLDMVGDFYVLTPDGAETQVTIGRKLFAIENGQETELTFIGHGSEQRTLQPGGHKDIAHLPIPSKASAGMQYRVEFSISADGKPASTAKATVTIE